MKMDRCNAVEKELDTVVSKLGSVSKEAVDHLGDLINKLKHVQYVLRTQSGGKGDSGVPMLMQSDCHMLSEGLTQIKNSVRKIADDHKKQHLAIAKVGKAIDKNFFHNINVIGFDEIEEKERVKIFMELIRQHLTSVGLFDVEKLLCEETGLPLNSASQRDRYVELHRILKALKSKNLEPVYNWAVENRQALQMRNSCLEFKVHRMAFIGILNQEPVYKPAAITYARANFPFFVDKHKKEIQELMGFVVFQGSDLKSPYKHILKLATWENLEDTFLDDICSLFQLKLNSPLAVCCDAGYNTLPSMINIANQLLQAHKTTDIWINMKTLPIENSLDNGFHFHSVFACPILRQQATENNPPIRLHCGHVISLDAVTRLNTMNRVKCPYCSRLQDTWRSREIKF